MTITGGKLTTWRRMAKMAVDRIVEREGRDAPCRTQEIPLGMPRTPPSLPQVDGVDDESRAQLARRYGHAAQDVMAWPPRSAELAERITPDLPDLVAEAAFAARREQARSLGRRAHPPHAARVAGRPRPAAPTAPTAPERAARAMAGELGWDERGCRRRSTTGARWRGPRASCPAPVGGQREAALA